MKEIIDVNPETGEVEEPTMMEKVKAFSKNHCGLLLGVLGVILGSIGAIITMRAEDDICDEEDIEDAGNE